MKLFYDDEYDALAQMIANSEKSAKELAVYLFPHLKPESAYARLKACLNADKDERLTFGQIIAAMRFCGQFRPAAVCVRRDPAHPSGQDRRRGAGDRAHRDDRLGRRDAPARDGAARAPAEGAGRVVRFSPRPRRLPCLVRGRLFLPSRCASIAPSSARTALSAWRVRRSSCCIGVETPCPGSPWKTNLLEDAVPKMESELQPSAAQDPSQPRRRGRPPGSKNAKKPAKKATKARKPRKVRKAGRRPGGRKPREVAPPASERKYSLFIDEDRELQLAPRDGAGDAITLSRADALAVAAFVEQHRTTFETN